VASLLADGRATGDALHALVAGLSLRTAVVRATDGELLAVAGEALQSVPPVTVAPPQDVLLEFPVTGANGLPLATLTVRGGRPSQLPALRAAAAILGLALSRTAPQHEHGFVPGLLADHEDAFEELADTLHDGPMQALMVARYAADAAVRGGDPVSAREAVQQAVLELRTLLWSIRSRGGSGLVPALEQLSEALVKAHRPPLDLTVDGSSGADGPAAVLAFRLVQAISSRAGDRQLRVVVRRAGAHLALDITGAGTPNAARWTQRAAALGCTLIWTGEQTRLVMPVASAAQARPLIPSSADARTSS